MRFNKHALDALAVPAGKPSILAWDDALKGFGVRVSAGGSRAWVAQYRKPDGTTARVTIGRCDTVALDDARRQARVLLGQAQAGNDPQADKAAKRAAAIAKEAAAVTFGSVVETYLSRARRLLKPRSFEEVERHLRKHWHPLHGTPIASIRRADIAAQLARVAVKGATNANRSRAYVSAFYTWAIGEGIVETNPVVGTNRPAEEVSRDRVLSAEELRAVWHACGDDDYGCIVRLLILTGQRREEVGGLTESELDLPGSLWTLPAERSKNGQPHEIPLSSAAVALLTGRTRIAGHQTVFGRRGTGFSGWSQCKTRLDRRIADTGVTVRPWRLHDLRRTAATMMAEHLAVPPHVVEAILNHVSGHRAGVAGIYNRATYRREKRESLNLWSEHLATLVRQDDALIAPGT